MQEVIAGLSSPGLSDTMLNEPFALQGEKRGKVSVWSGVRMLTAGAVKMTDEVAVGPGLVDVVGGIVVERPDLRDEVVLLCLSGSLDDTLALEVAPELRVRPG